MSGPAREVLPLPGPLENDPTGVLYDLLSPAGAGRFAEGYPTPESARELARDMFTTAVTGLPLGAYDRRILASLAGSDVGTVATVASLMHRCSMAGAGIEAARWRRAATTVRAAAAEADARLSTQDADRQEIAEDLIYRVRAALWPARGEDR